MRSVPANPQPHEPVETVVLIHGTFAGPHQAVFDSTKQPGELDWYEPGSEFCKALDARLEAAGSRARCWAHLENGEPYFAWSGENSWIGRREGGSTLHRHLAEAHGRGWRCHVIAHSHGGNVLLEALNYLKRPPPAWYRGNCLLLATPIVDAELNRLALAPGVMGITVRALSVAIFLWLVAAWAPFAKLTEGVGALAAWAGAWALPLLAAAAVALIGTAVALAAWVALALRKVSSIPVSEWHIGELPWDMDYVRTDSRLRPRLAVWHARGDEAVSTLRALAGSANPLLKQLDEERVHHSVGTQVRQLDAVVFAGESARRNAAMSAGIWGWAAALIALTRLPSPGIAVGVWLLLGLVLCGLVCRRPSFTIGLYLPVRVVYLTLVWAWLTWGRWIGRLLARLGWGTVTATAFGLAGAPVRRARVLSEPAWLRRGAGGDYEYEQLDDALLPDGHAIRDAKAGELWRTVQDLLREPDWDIRSLAVPLLRGQAGLLHGAYFRSPPLIEKIAAWLALSEEQRRAEAERLANNANAEIDRIYARVEAERAASSALAPASSAAAPGSSPAAAQTPGTPPASVPS